MRPNEPFKDVVHRLVDVLKQERAHILSGDFSELPEFSAAKERSLFYIEQHLSGPDARNILSVHAGSITALKKLASENEKLLNSSRAGVKSAQERLTHLNKIDSVVGTYTENGGQLRLEGSATTCKKIA